MNLEHNSRIAVSQKQLHGNSSVITSGELVSVNGNTATVLLDGEAVVREVAVSALASSDALIGSISNRANEQSIVNMMPNMRRY